MARADIQFQAAGWGGIVGEDFTFGRVRSLAAAIARVAGARRKHSAFLVAYDTRFLSDEFAKAAANAVESAGARAFLVNRPTPIPALSFEILRRKMAGGMYVGAGCEPADYNGLKFLEPNGAPAGRERWDEIERIAGESAEEERISGEAESIEIETIDPSEFYLERLRELVRLDAIRSAGMELVCDLMHGTGAGWLDRLLVAAGVTVRVLNEDRDVLFGGRAPDPSPANLEGLGEIVRETGAALGLATGGEGRRFGIVDNKGRCVPPSQIYELLCNYPRESRGWRLQALQDGAITFGGHVPESDGILACLLTAEMVAERGTLDTQLKKLRRRAGAK
jgi:phosphoglucomutase